MCNDEVNFLIFMMDGVFRHAASADTRSSTMSVFVSGNLIHKDAPESEEWRGNGEKDAPFSRGAGLEPFPNSSSWLFF